jgi:hypothetical protein
MKRKLIKRLVWTTSLLLALSMLVLCGAWVGSRFEPSIPARQAEVRQFEAMSSRLDWKPTALGLIKSRQDLVHERSSIFSVLMAVSAVFVLLTGVNIAWLRRLARFNNDANPA